jgi:hypothetical protein
VKPVTGPGAKYSVGVADQKPPRLAGSEAKTLRALLHFQRESLVRTVADLDDAAARWSPVETGTSLLWLVKHMARAELNWLPAPVRRAGGRPTPRADRRPNRPVAAR